MALELALIEGNSMKTSTMKVPSGLYYKSAFFQKTKRFWKFLSKLESKILDEEIKPISIKNPIYITGIARSGSTILLEMLNKHKDLTSHRYSDFPNIYTPYWHNWLKQKTSKDNLELTERTHQDRIKISEHSPEAIEEVLWMEFFRGRHDNNVSQVLTAKDSNHSFESYYTNHIKKLLLIRNRKRYLCKGNYNLTRLKYILSIFPDARLIIPVRNPINHIASCIKQDQLYDSGLKNNPRAQRYLSWVGHFEFGPDKKFINIENPEDLDNIKQAFKAGENVKAWALHWNSLNHFVLKQRQQNKELADASLLIKYEDLCQNSEQHIDTILNHCDLDINSFSETRQYYAKHLKEPSYYKTQFSNEEHKLITDICGNVASLLGYTI